MSSRDSFSPSTSSSLAPHGPRAKSPGEMIGELALAITAKQKVGVLSSTIHAYPTQVEALRKIGDIYMRTKLTPVLKTVFGKWLAWRRR